MMVFHGGLTSGQVEKIKNGEYKIFNKVPSSKIVIENGLNTFCYCHSNKIYESMDALKKDASRDLYENQYIFCFKYLSNAVRFCSRGKSYILVADLSEEILNQYIGVGKYIDGYKIECRIPSRIIIPEHVVEVAHCSTTKNVMELKEKYVSTYKNFGETEKAKKLMKERNLELVDYRLYIKGD